MTDPPPAGQSQPRTPLEPISDTDASTDEFEALFMAHHAYVRRSLSYFGVGGESVDDLAQEVFLVLHRRLAEFDPSRDIRSWLFGIARRVAQTHRRGMARAERKLAAVPEAEPVAQPEEELARSEEVAVVDRFIASLPDKLRDVFVLVEIEGCSAPEVAEMLDLKVNTVYSRLRLGRERFTKAFARRRPKEGSAHAR